MLKDKASAPRSDIEPEWKVLEVLTDENSSFRALIEHSDKRDLFRYSIERYFGPADEDEGQWPDGFWDSILCSGLYDSVLQATKDAHASLIRSEIDRFIAWGTRLAATARSSSLNILVEACAPTLNPAARIDFENSKFLGRITLWSDGDFYAEALDATTAATIISEHGRLAAGVNFGEEFSGILKFFAIY